MCLKMPFIGLNSHSQKGRVTVVKKMPMYCTARPKIAPQNGSAEHVQVPGNSDLSNLACRGAMDQPRCANRDVRITPTNEAPQCKARTPGSSAYQLLPESGYWSSQTQRAGDLLTCFELFQRHLTNLPRFYKVVQDDCIWLQIHTKMPRCKMSQRRPHNKNEYTHAHQKMINIYIHIYM